MVNRVLAVTGRETGGTVRLFDDDGVVNELLPPSQREVLQYSVMLSLEKLSCTVT